MFAFALVFVVAIFSFVALGKARHAAANYDDFIETLETQEAELKSGVNDVDTEQYLEEQARNYLGMIKDGETLYIFK